LDHLRHSAITRRAWLVALTLCCAAGLGCADTFRLPNPAAGGASSATTALNGFDDAFEAFAIRFLPNQYGARYLRARAQIGESALVPSRIFDDTTIWDRLTVSRRVLYVAGAPTADGRYALEPLALPTRIQRTGETRHRITLERTGSDAYRWDTHVDIGVGSLRSDDVAAALEALLAAPEGRAERAVRADYRGAFPRTTAAFGRGFSLDSVSIVPGAQGTTTVTLRFGFRPERMRPAFPLLADYLDKYLKPAKYHLVVSDYSAVPLFDVLGRDRSMTLRYRVQNGALVTLAGAPRPWPESLRLTADFSLKVKLFTIGVRHLVTDFEISNAHVAGGHERAWTVIARHEPEWDLPLFTERLIRAPLRKPFEGEGALFSMTVRDADGASGQALFQRDTRLAVQESAIMRFIGSLASHVVGELDDRVEVDEHRFLREGFVALQADARALRSR
jgi:hypothetical protein